MWTRWTILEIDYFLELKRNIFWKLNVRIIQGHEKATALDAHGCLENYDGVEKLDLEFRDWPPNYNDDNSNQFIIYCDIKNWATNGHQWASGGLIFNYEVADLCQPFKGDPRVLAITYLNAKIPFIVLCDILKPPKGQRNNLEDWSTFSALSEAGKLNYGVYFSTAIRETLSFILLHELFHVARGKDSEYRLFLC
jgi:hypothetical protein